MPTWLQLGSPNPSQHGAKLAPKSIQVGVLIWELFLKWSWHYFYWFFITTWHGRRSEKYTKTLGFQHFWFFGCCVVGMICWLIFDRFLVDLEVENRSKINQKSMKKASQNKMRFGIDFEGLLERSWGDFEPKLGAKLGPRWHQYPTKNDVDKHAQKCL